MTADELQKIRSYLPKKSLSILAKSTGRSTVYVWQVLNGKGYNDEVLDAAILLAKQHKVILDARAELMAQL